MNLFNRYRSLLSLSLAFLLTGCATATPPETVVAPTSAPATAVPTIQLPTDSPTVVPTVVPTAVPTIAPTLANTPEAAVIPTEPTTAVPENLTYTIVATYPHDPSAFTQGLQIIDGQLYEGTGLRGQSSLRKVDLSTGAVQQSISLDPAYFGEGITVLGDRIYQLTWQAQVAFLYERDTFEKIAEFSYPTEGWGLTFDGAQLVMSDGTANIYFRDPETFDVTRTITVTDGDQQIHMLNELEYINGEIYANIWQTDWIVRIDPATGNVTAWLDMAGLLDNVEVTQPVNVLNGIAWDADAEKLYVTGKLWPALFEIELIPAP